MSSERKQRTAMENDLEAIDVKAESVPFTFSETKVDRLFDHLLLPVLSTSKEVLFHILDELKRLNQLKWHNDVIPADEILLKIGGDKGGSTMKLSQIVNLKKPNSVGNSVKLHLALDQYEEVISVLQKTKWRPSDILKIDNVTRDSENTIAVR
uniref:Uncharacterized protein n=1 Tax=Amphimedon queenslandica TaxID=400682 RepID=A0A1X7V186_AMPQE